MPWWVVLLGGSLLLGMVNSLLFPAPELPVPPADAAVSAVSSAEADPVPAGSDAQPVLPPDLLNVLDELAACLDSFSTGELYAADELPVSPPDLYNLACVPAATTSSWRAFRREYGEAADRLAWGAAKTELAAAADFLARHSEPKLDPLDVWPPAFGRAAALVRALRVDLEALYVDES